MAIPRNPTRSVFDRIALVLQGGGALGAYQAGFYQAMVEYDLTPQWIAGTSIGAINGALIAGNTADRRLARLREFWETVSASDFWRGPQGVEGLQAAHSMWSILQSMTAGRPGFFAPRWFNPALLYPVGSAETASFYDVRPLRETLQRLIDFELLNDGSIRLSVGTVNIRSGTPHYFDSKAEQLNPAHILASGALPPGFPAVQIEEELYWDGGIYSNTPLEIILDEIPRRNTLCFILSLFNPAGTEPRSIAEAEKRHKEITYGSRMHEHVRAYRRVHNLRRALRSLYALLPDDVKNDPEIGGLAEQGCETTMHIVELIYPTRNWETCFNDADFSRASVEERWSDGYKDGCLLLQRAPWKDPVPAHIGVAVHTMTPGHDAAEENNLAWR